MLFRELYMCVNKRFIAGRWLPRCGGLWLALLLAACGPWRMELLPEETIKCAEPSPPVDLSVTFTSAVPEFGSAETGRQDIKLGVLECPGQYVLRLKTDSPPYSNHWIEWDYVALKAGDQVLWQIGQSESPPDLNYTGSATDEFCGTDCRSEFEVTAGHIDERAFPKTLNDGSQPAVAIRFAIPAEQKGADLILTLSTLYASHVPDTRDFKLRVILERTSTQ
jgi:hypothetical protein